MTTQSMGQPSCYDWGQFGRHRLRAPSAMIVDLPIPVASGAHVWVGTLWPDERVAGGWGRAVWDVDPVRGGWCLPGHLAAGDVLEFGADTLGCPVRWFGIMDSYEPDRWVTVQGPYASPAVAWVEAQRLLAFERFLPALSSEPVAARTDRDRSCRLSADRPRRHR